MQKKNSVSSKRRDERAVVLPGKAIGQFKADKKLTHAELASLLGVNPATLSRWISDRTTDMPTSTTFLVLIPLLLSTGRRELMPEYYENAVMREFQSVFGAAEVKKNEKKLREMAYQRFLRANPDVQRARRLFDALKEAWQILDSETPRSP